MQRAADEWWIDETRMVCRQDDRSARRYALCIEMAPVEKRRKKETKKTPAKPIENLHRARATANRSSSVGDSDTMKLRELNAHDQKEHCWLSTLSCFSRHFCFAATGAQTSSYFIEDQLRRLFGRQS